MLGPEGGLEQEQEGEEQGICIVARDTLRLMQKDIPKFKLVKTLPLYILKNTMQENATLSSLWRRKFEREDLPLLEEGADLDGWLKIYHRSLEAMRVAHERIDSGRIIQVAISRVPELSLLRVSDLDQENWDLIQSNNVDRFLDWLITEKDIVHDYYLILSPRAGFYLYEKVDKQEEMLEGGIIYRTLSLTGSNIALTKDDAWFLLYRLAYFGYPF